MIGPGYMGIEYTKVLNSLKKNFLVIGRSEKSKNKFYNKTHKRVEDNSLDYCLKNLQIPKKVIISANIESTVEIASKLIKNGAKSILLEKPGSLNKNNLIKLKKLSSIKNAQVYIAYNRRYLSSIIEAKKIIKKDKKILSAFFDFTELSDKIKKTKHSTAVKNKWLIANSTHVIDLVFHLCGKPKKIFSLNKGSLDWHPSSSIFVGSGVTEEEILFSYSSNWGSPGRWHIEIMTIKHKLIFSPMETLKVIKKNCFIPVKINFDNKIDKRFKPGLYKLVKSFLNSEDNDLCKLDEQINNFDIFSKIANY